VPKKAFLIDFTSFTGGSLFKLEATKHIAPVFLRIFDEFGKRCLVTHAR